MAYMDVALVGRVMVQAAADIDEEAVVRFNCINLRTRQYANCSWP